MQPRPLDQMDDGRDQRDGKYGQDEKVEGRIKTRMIGKVLGGCVSHGVRILFEAGNIIARFVEAAEKVLPDQDLSGWTDC